MNRVQISYRDYFHYLSPLYMGKQVRDDIFISKIGKKLRSLRNAKGVSQINVYIDTNVNVKRIEAGTQNISVSTLAILCEYYGISLKDFFDGI